MLHCSAAVFLQHLADGILHLVSQAALSVLARMLHCSAGVFGFAGTKDKRAITEQAATAFKVADARLAGLNRSLRCSPQARKRDSNM